VGGEVGEAELDLHLHGGFDLEARVWGSGWGWRGRCAGPWRVRLLAAGARDGRGGSRSAGPDWVAGWSNRPGCWEWGCCRRRRGGVLRARRGQRSGARCEWRCGAAVGLQNWGRDGSSVAVKGLQRHDFSHQVSPSSFFRFSFAASNDVRLSLFETHQYLGRQEESSIFSCSLIVYPIRISPIFTSPPAGLLELSGPTEDVTGPPLCQLPGPLLSSDGIFNRRVRTVRRRGDGLRRRSRSELRSRSKRRPRQQSRSKRGPRAME
jgi:hypothetical protein